MRELVELRLCASGNITPSIRSIYRWKGEIYDRPEALATLHTRRDRVETIARLADERHPYDVPRVVAVPFVAGSRAYFDWVKAGVLRRTPWATFATRSERVANAQERTAVSTSVPGLA